MLNEIAQLRTQTLETPQGVHHAILLAINVGNAAALPSFMPEVLSQFMSQRMISPPDTDMMLVTIIGELTADRFVELWHAAVARDRELRGIQVFMSRMAVADVIHGTRDGRTLDQSSLLSDRR